MRKAFLTATIAAVAIAPMTEARAATPVVLWTTGGVSQCGGTLSLICAQWTLLLTGPDEYRLELMNTSYANPTSMFAEIGIGDGDPARTWSIDAASFQSQGNAWQIDPGAGNPYNGFGMLSIIFDASTIGNPNTSGVGVGESVWFSWRMTSTPPGGSITELGIHDLKGLIQDSDKTVFQCETNGLCPPTVVPEPASLGLMATGLAAMGAAMLSRRRNRAAGAV